MSDHVDRSEEERERARQEREARRAARAAGTAAPAPPPARRDFGRPPSAGNLDGSYPRQPEPRPRRSGPIAGLFLIGLAVAVIWFLVSLYQPGHGDGGKRVRVSVPRGATLDSIAQRLDGAGVVSSPFFFKLRARMSGHADDLKPGIYSLRKDMAYSDVVDRLRAGVPKRLIQLTIPEGRARWEAAPLVRSAGIKGSYLRATVRSRYLNPRSYRAPRGATLEGFLFPATYELRRGASARGLVHRQLAAFRKNFAGVDMSYARRKNLTPFDVLTIASMVEREAQLQRERPLIASVIYNRLHEHMPLGIDATIRYAVRNWTHPLRESELHISSGYNTRTHTGLPPGPIGSPGLASIRAAAHPARTRYLYYVVKPGRCGVHAFSSTDAQRQRDVNRYNAARAKKGGKSPTTC
jgi:uncharacterized YceG family protein